ncbi:Bacterial membrane flanked domain protein [compost metagenome]
MKYKEINIILRGMKMEERETYVYIEKDQEVNEFKNVDKKAVKSWRTARVITFLIFLAIFIGVRIFIKNWDETFVLVATIIQGVILLLLALNAFLYPKIEYRQWKYSITEDKIEFYHGIFFVQHTIIPMLRIQHITVNQGPINKLYKIATVSISTAGGVFGLVGLPKETADEICDYINNRVIKKLKDRANEQVLEEEILLEPQETGVDNNG